MQNTLNIALNTIKINLKERRVIIMMIIFPILLILILGNALKAAYEPGQMGEINVGYVNEDTGDVSSAFTEFLDAKEITDIVDITIYDSFEEGNNKLSIGEIDALIHIGKGYSDTLKTSDLKAEIEVLYTDSSGYKSTVVNSIVDSFINGANLTSALNVMTNTSSITSKYEGNSVVEDKMLSITGERPRAIDYYAVTMLVMILMYGITYSAEGLGIEMFGNMQIRIKSLPLKASQIFIGKMLGSMGMLIIQGLIILGVTHYVFKVNWGGNISIIIAIILVISMFSTAFGVMLCTITKDVDKARKLISLLVPLLTFLGGGYIKIDLGVIKYLSPNYLMQSAFFNQIFGNDLGITMTYIGIILFLVITMLGISSVLGRRRLA